MDFPNTCPVCNRDYEYNTMLLYAIIDGDLAEIDRVMRMVGTVPFIRDAIGASLLKDDTLPAYAYLRGAYHTELGYGDVIESLYTAPFPGIHVHEFAQRGGFNLDHILREYVPHYIGTTLAHYADGHDPTFERTLHLLNQFSDVRALRCVIARARTEADFGGDLAAGAMVTDEDMMPLIANNERKRLALLAIDAYMMWSLETAMSSVEQHGDVAYEERMRMLMATGIRADRAGTVRMPPPDTWTDTMGYHRS